MHLKTRNVNTAFTTMVAGIHYGEIPTYVTASRYGEVAQIEEPVTLTYQRPLERVLFNAARDANPFFHLYEALWMLAGRNDVAPLTYYCSRMKEFSDDGETLNGAYGYRWRNYADNQDPRNGVERIDQIYLLVNHLRSNPHSRRAVLQMWNVEDDLLKIGTPSGACATGCQGSGCTCKGSVDVCCNLSAVFQIEQGECPTCKGTGRLLYDETRLDGSRTGFQLDYEDPKSKCPKCKGLPHNQPQFLNMTVFNRSNDLTWGMLGANAVHFSFLQEYMAALLGLEIGVYHQITNNLHVYTSRWEPVRWLELAKSSPAVYENYWKSPKLVKDAGLFDLELPLFVRRYSGSNVPASHDVYNEPFLRTVAQPMLEAYAAYKRREPTVLSYLDRVEADDWRIAGRQWMERRLKWNKTTEEEDKPETFDPDFAVS